MTPNILLLPDIREILNENGVQSIVDFCSTLHPASIAEILDGLSPSEIWSILRHIEVVDRGNIFSYFDDELQVKIIESAPRSEIAEFIEYLPSDDRADILDDIKPKILNEILPLVSREEQKDIERLRAYPEGTCGAEMSSDFVRLHEEMTVQQALNEISNQTHVLETVFYLYVLDKEDRLVGLISAKEIVKRIGKPETQLKTFMKRDLIIVDANADREEAVKLVAKYDFVAIPVLDENGKMLGIITHDDIVDTILEEMTENAHMSAAVNPLGDSTYLETNLIILARKRFVWLAILLFGALSTALILTLFETVNKEIVWLVAFLPMIVSTGGNCGGQSATLVITALATGEISLKDWAYIFRREIAMGILLGSAMGFCAFINALLILQGNVPFLQLLIIPAAVFLVVFSSNMTGALLPLLFQRFGWDPALMSNPFVAGISDTLGTFIYMLLALCFLLPIYS
ncbi:MAG: magnesium transporter [Planctomycetia bacterium]|nr:magnesium transporter [Planctomycetia bacterium]